MSYIQKISNKNGDAYRVFIRNKGQKIITKTFKDKQAAKLFSAEIEFNSTLRDKYSTREVLFNELSRQYINEE